ncbi:hypothetical protein JG688_00013629 [Phytophthora aleatoria]|uniref:Uncharacterized protein n=1 Tax=Phytophthora aleatoria TaxID=2496075 RepID=A0A8J5ILX7_9STRA|nr:hypothetical protein JG688_00013629 [Phytophthora aleatoria]
MQWLCEYFPECFECCGVVIQLLSEQSDDEKAENDIGMIRLLDMCLLVIKAGLDYFETKRDDWFDEDDSEGSDSEQEAGVPLQTDVDENGSSQVECLASTTTVPQWFEDVDDEEEPDVDLLQCASENSNSLPEALGLATQWERDTCAVDRVVGTDETSKHQH